MGKGGRGKTQKTTQTTAPWAGVQPYLQDYLGSASQWYGGGQPRVAGLAPETEQAWQLGAQRALQGSPLTQAAQGALMPTISGESGQEAFNKLFQTATRGVGEQFRDIVMPSIASRFGAAGRSGSGMEQAMTERAIGQLGQTLGDIGTNIYGQERGRQMQAIGMAPQMAGLDYMDLGQLAQIGAQKRGYEQEQLGAPLQALQQYGALLQPGLGYGTSTSQQPLQSSPLSSMLGGGLAGYGISSTPWGAGIGAGAGLLGSLGF